MGCKLWFCHPSVICGQEFFSGNASVTLHRLWWHTFMQMCATPSMACLGAERAQSAHFEAHEMISGVESYHQRLYASQVRAATRVRGPVTELPALRARSRYAKATAVVDTLALSER